MDGGTSRLKGWLGSGKGHISKVDLEIGRQTEGREVSIPEW